MILERLRVLSSVFLQLHGPRWVKLEEDVPRFHKSTLRIGQTEQTYS